MMINIAKEISALLKFFFFFKKRYGTYMHPSKTVYM